MLGKKKLIQQLWLVTRKRNYTYVIDLINYWEKGEQSDLISYQDIKIEGVDESICCPAHTIKEVSQREPEWHIFHAPRFYNLCLFIIYIPRPK